MAAYAKTKARRDESGDPHRPLEAVPPPGSAPAGDLPPRARNSGLPWLVALVVATGGVSAFYSARSQLGVEKTAHVETQARLDTSRNDADELRATLATLEAENARLAAESRQLADEAKTLADHAASKEEALAAMQRTQTELEQRLAQEITNGDVLISRQQGELVVDLIDKIVFDSGEATVNEKGKAVLRQVGETLAKVDDRMLLVSGHTDGLKISDKLETRYPSNWELSVARAIHVVRFLQEELKLPGERLMAAGLAEFRPVASNRTPVGRRRNRRIEVRLLPLPAK